MEISVHQRNVKANAEIHEPNNCVVCFHIFSTFRTISHWYNDLYLISRIVEFSVHRKNVHRFDTLCVSVQLYMQIRPHQPRKTPSIDDKTTTTTSPKLTQVVNYFSRMYFCQWAVHRLLNIFVDIAFVFLLDGFFVEKSVFQKLNANYEKECPLIRYK